MSSDDSSCWFLTHFKIWLPPLRGMIAFTSDSEVFCHLLIWHFTTNEVFHND